MIAATERYRQRRSISSSMTVSNPSRTEPSYAEIRSRSARISPHSGDSGTTAGAVMTRHVAHITHAVNTTTHAASVPFLTIHADMYEMVGA